jgi:TPR repeat protein
VVIRYKSLLLFFYLLTPALQADYQSGLDAYLQGDYDTAITEWQAVVESPPGTVPDAMRAETLYAIGMLFWLGQGVEQDIFEAASWITLAAEMNHAGAQNKLGFLYSLGQGVKQSDFTAFKWWQMAANQGDEVAQFNLGVMYRDGLGVEPNPEESMKWFREAASNGDPVSIGIVEEVEAGSGVTSVPEDVPLATEDEPEALENKADAPETVQKDVAAVGRSYSELPNAAQENELDTYAAGESWIAEQDPEHYTIQVIALSEPEKLYQFIAEQPGLEPFAIYRQTRYKNPLWVLVQGDYPDLNSARLSLQAFPETLQQRQKLWIRRFEVVQRALE